MIRAVLVRTGQHRLAVAGSNRVGAVAGPIRLAAVAGANQAGVVVAGANQVGVVVAGPIPAVVSPGRDQAHRAAEAAPSRRRRSYRSPCEIKVPGASTGVSGGSSPQIIPSSGGFSDSPAPRAVPGRVSSRRAVCSPGSVLWVIIPAFRLYPPRSVGARPWPGSCQAAAAVRRAAWQDVRVGPRRMPL